MSTKSSLEIKKKLTAYRSTIETPFYGNNVIKVPSIARAYELAKNAPGTIVTDRPIYEPQKNGLPSNAKILVFNDGEVYGRCAQAQRIAGTKIVDEKKFTAILREATYLSRFRKMYHAEAFIGLHEDFMLKANLLVPEGFENNLLSWLLNFQECNQHFKEMYERSKQYNEPDLFIYSDPYWSSPEFPLGIAFFDPENNCACLLGLRYFGEHKKGSLTLAWGVANRNGFASAHGGLKRYNHNNYVMAVFGLSGSGKSSITHAHHDHKYNITIVHDDAFIINMNNKSSLALEPSYYDKTQDYPIGSEDNKFILTAQNVGVTLNEKGEVDLVTEDIRNPNGRAVKSRLWSSHRVDKINEKICSIVWLMKDPTMPPLVKVNDPTLGSALGATLSTKRTSAERVIGNSLDNLVVEPYANPFRTYQLKDDYFKYKQLLEEGIDCYILNTGHFGEKKVPKELTISLVEKIAENKIKWVNWPGLPSLQFEEIDGFTPDMKNSLYVKELKERMEDRVKFIETRGDITHGHDSLPVESINAIKKLIEHL